MTISLSLLGGWWFGRRLGRFVWDVEGRLESRGRKGGMDSADVYARPEGLDDAQQDSIEEDKSTRY
jgi:hypothetical protein